MTVSKKIKKAIIPVAGMGTRFLPATKAQPKEMLTVVDKPVIQYIVEEVAAAGIEEIIFVTAIGKRAIEDHFDRNFELEYRLEQKGRSGELAGIRKIGRLANFAFVRQNKPLGDGHAILSARPFVGPDEAVAVLFGDDIILSDRPAIGQLMEVFEKFGRPVVALEEVPEEKVSSYGIVGGQAIEEKIWRLEKFVEKPALADSPSRLAVVGRYIITPEIFEILKNQSAGGDGEVRLAGAFGQFLAGGGTVYGRELEGRRYDCGSKLEFIIAQVELGLRHPDLKDRLRRYFKRFQTDEN